MYNVLPFVCGSSMLVFVWYALLCVHSSFTVTLKRKKKLVASLLLSYRCCVTINVMWLFLTALWVGLQSVIVVFPDHTHLLFYAQYLFLKTRPLTGEAAITYGASLREKAYDCEFRDTFDEKIHKHLIKTIENKLLIRMLEIVTVHYRSRTDWRYFLAGK